MEGISRRLVLMCGVVVVMHTTTGYLEEELFKKLAFKSAFFMVLVMCVMYVFGYLAVSMAKGGSEVLSVIMEHVRGGKSADRRTLGLLCVAYVGSNALSKFSLNYVSVPMMIVFKSCKLVCVMAGSTIVLGKVYSTFEYCIAFCLVLGMISFSLADMHGPLPSIYEDAATLIGILVLVLALCFDSALGNLQEKVQKSRVCDEYSLMFVQSVASSVLLIMWTGLTGELKDGMSHCFRDAKVFYALMGWALSNMAGIVVMLRVVGEFSAVTAVVLSLVRKFTSLVVSYALFPKRAGTGHMSGLALVFVSVVLHSFRRQLFTLLEKSKMAFGNGMGQEAEIKAPLPHAGEGSVLRIQNDQDLIEKGEIFAREHTAGEPGVEMGQTQNKSH